MPTSCADAIVVCLYRIHGYCWNQCPITELTKAFPHSGSYFVASSINVYAQKLNNEFSQLLASG